jgi:hypothetical protein
MSEPMAQCLVTSSRWQIWLHGETLASLSPVAQSTCVQSSVLYLFFFSATRLRRERRVARVGSITTQLLLRATRTLIARPPVIWLTVPVLAPARLRAYRLCSILQVGLGCDDQTLHTARPLNEMWPQISDLLGIRGRVSVRPSLLPTLDAGIASVLSLHVAC